MLLTSISTRQSYEKWLVVTVWWEPREQAKEAQAQRQGIQLNKMRRGKCFQWKAGTQNM